jgi:hypothetical protein
MPMAREAVVRVETSVVNGHTPQRSRRVGGGVEGQLALRVKGPGQATGRTAHLRLDGRGRARGNLGLTREKRAALARARPRFTRERGGECEQGGKLLNE